jgi:hypothetical protein
MIAFQRLSTVSTVPELLRRDAQRQAARTFHALPMEVWCRPATIAVVRHNQGHSLLRATGPIQTVRIRTEFFRPSDELARMKAASHDRMLSWPSIQTRPWAIATQRGFTATALHTWRYRVGTEVCFAGASGVLAAARLLHWCSLISSGGLGTALACSAQLTRAGMRLWRRGRT